MKALDSAAESLLADVRDDHESGATKLALLTLGKLLTYIDDVSPDVDALSHLISELRAARPSMIVIDNALALVEERIEQNPAEPGSAILDIRKQLEGASSAIARQARDELVHNPVIMTHSASSVVLSLFQALAEAGAPFSVICTQSEPGLEGHSLAVALNDLSVPVTLITDAQMALFVTEADVVITGCDTWLADGYFTNKAGTHLLALAAKAAGTPLWVLADSFRNSEKNHDSAYLEEMPATELNAPEGRWITARNVYFEAVPGALVDKRISEQGVFSFPAEPGH